MRIKKIPVAQINPALYNPRKQLAPGDPGYEKLLRSIDEFGLVEPLVWNKRSGNLVGGHQRLSVLLARGEREITVSIVDLPPERRVRTQARHLQHRPEGRPLPRRELIPGRSSG